MKKLFTLFAAVVMMALASLAGEVTVANGEAQDSHYPFYALYYDTPGTLSQMIYPSVDLTELAGKTITQIKFYTSNSTFYLNGGNLQFSMAEVDEAEYPTSDPVDLGDSHVICNVAPTYGTNELVLTLEEPFYYDGSSHLLIESLVTEAGNYQTVYFQGVMTGLYCSMYQYQGWSGTWYAYTGTFLPKATFVCEDEEVPVPEGITVEPAATSAYAQWEIDEVYYNELWNLRYREYGRAAEWIYNYYVMTPFTTIEGLTPETTYELQVQAFDADNESLVSEWSPSVIFTTLAQAPTPTEKTQTPDGSYQVVAGQHEVVVTITPYEGDVFFRIIYTSPDGSVTEYDWAPYVDSFSVYEDGRYRIEFYAVADGKLPSDPGAVEFTVSPMTGLEEMTTGKTIASVRYFNALGQEMQEANGMTIVVTTYTDGTSSAVKVMK